MEEENIEWRLWMISGNSARLLSCRLEFHIVAFRTKQNKKMIESSDMRIDIGRRQARLQFRSPALFFDELTGARE
jgi:hypothetical protein